MRLRSFLALLPALLLVILLCIVPVLLVVKVSVFDPGPTLEHFRRFAAQSVYGTVLMRTLKVSAIVAGLCLLVGYPAALFVFSRPERWRTPLLFLVLLPMWMSVLIRTYAWMVLLGREGVINSTLLSAGLVDGPLTLLFTTGAVYVSMVQILLPVMILTCYGGMTAIDASLIPAARIMGAGRLRAFREVFLPLSLPSALNGAIVVFVLSLSFFIAPALLGGRRDTMIGNLITTQVEQANWGFAGALSMILLAATLILLWLVSRLVRALGGTPATGGTAA